MEIKIIDSCGAIHRLDFDFRKYDTKNLYYKSFNLIKNSFRTEFEKIKTFFLFNEQVKFKISLEEEKIKGEATVLASFDVSLSSELEYVFLIYYSTLSDIAKKVLNLDSDINNLFEDTILHELIHAIDLNTLKKTHAIETNDLRLSKRESDFKLNNFNDKKYDITLQWAVLSFFETFRNEGIAVLGQKLFSNNEIISLNKTLDEILKFFRILINRVLSLSVDLKFYNTLEKGNLLTELNELALNAYLIADTILLTIIQTSSLDLSSICEKTLDYILFNKGKKPSADEIKQLMAFAIDIDMSEYINAVMKHPFNIEGREIINKKQLLECCALIQDDSNYDAIDSFSKNIGIIGYNKSGDNFIKLMRESIGSCMSLGEIEENYLAFSNKTYVDEIVLSIKLMAEKLYKLALNQNDIAKWALTYLLDDEDLIHDNIAIIGWQDDWVVLDSAMRILDLKIEN